MSLFSRLANVFRPDRLTRDIDEELAAHLEEAAAHGRDPAAARRALGPSLRLREQSRDARLIPWLDSLRADTVFAWRQLNKHRVTSLAAILSLALAIGSCTAAFRIIDALFLRPLPIAHPERLYAITFPGIDADGKPHLNDSWSYPFFRQVRAAVENQADLLAVSYSGSWEVTYKSDQDFEHAKGQYVSARMFALFGLHPAMGRLLSEDDDSVPGRAYAVLSFDYWTRRFGRDSHVIGRTFRYQRNLFTIVGVAPEGFTGVEPGTLNDIFIPAMMNSWVNDPHVNWFRALALLKPGASVEPVRTRILAAARVFWEEEIKSVPDVPREVANAILNQQAVLEPARSGVSWMQRNYRQALVSLALLVALVLLIACANVANLMTAQAAARAREMALRISIGAGRARLIQLVLVESATLAVFAAAAGGLFAVWSAPFVVSRINPPNDPARLTLPMDWRVTAFLLIMTFAIALLLGLAPALRASRVDPFGALKSGGSQSGGRLMHVLIAVQAAFCILVLFVAGLFVNTFNRLSHEPLGFSADRLLALGVLAGQPQPPAFWDHVLDNLRATPGVESAARTEWALLTGASWNTFIAPNGGQLLHQATDFLSVSPGWIETMKTPLLAGRDFRPGELFPGEVAIVNQTFADQFYNGDALGKFFVMPLGVDNSSSKRVTIIGLLANARYANMREPIPPVAYVPVRSDPMPDITVMVRTAANNPLTLVPTLRQAIANASPGLRLSSATTQQDIDQAQTVRERLLAMLAAFFGAVALLLAGVGLYGVLDYSVFQRRREIGIRMAVGARPAHIVRGVTLGVVVWILAGSAAGLLLGLASVRYIESLLYQVRATDAGALAIPALTFLAAAILAALPPLLRAIRVDPVQVLRSE